MLQVNLNANVRTGHGKGAARTLRRTGQTPGILYGLGSEPVSLALDTKTLTRELLGIQRRNAIVNLAVDGEGKKFTKHVLIKEVQVDPIKDTPVHADFCEISLEKKMSLIVPLVFIGKAKGVDLGGEMQLMVSNIVVEGKPLDIPDNITVDVSGLDIGDNITCGELSLPQGIALIGNAAKVCVAVTTASAKKAGGEGKEEGAE